MKALLLAALLAVGCEGALPDPMPPAPVDCPLAATDLRDGIGVFDCVDGRSLCYGEFTTPPEGCYVWRGTEIERLCVLDCVRQ